METFSLHNGLTLPQIGFGTYRSEIDAIQSALHAGYRYFDTASFYDTEATLSHAIARSGIPRTNCMVATKLWKTEMGYDAALRACESSLKQLGMDYLDVYLIHWPRPDLSCDWKTLDRETWRALERLYEAGTVRAIGVSNFLPAHLENLFVSANIAPMIDQIEFHPGYTQMETVEFCLAHDILPQAWSPIGRARLFSHPVLLQLAEKYKVSAAQICLRFAVQCHVMPLPKSTSPDRIAQNIEVFQFALEPEDLQRLKDLPLAGWSGEHPDKERVPAISC